VIFLWTLLAAVLSVVLTEAGVVLWLNLAGSSIDLVGHYFLLAVSPVLIVVAVLIGLLFNRFFAADPKLFGPLYLALWMALHATALYLMENPANDVAIYVELILLIGGLVLIGFYFMRWRAPMTPGQQSPPVSE
jgi:hypothetical protein